MPTADWLQKQGWLMDPNCLCGAVDDQQHRLGQWFLTEEAIAQLAAAAGGIGSHDVGFGDLKLGRPPRPSEPVITCYENAAIGQHNEQGHRSVKVTLPWQSPQTAGFAEHMAALVCSSLMAEPNKMVTDCSAVVTNARLGRAEATKYSNTMAGVMKVMDMEMIEEVVKTKAHRSAAQAAAQGPEQVVAHRLNEWVDSIAKRAARDGILDSRATEKVVSDLDDQTRRLRALAACLAEA